MRRNVNINEMDKQKTAYTNIAKQGTSQTIQPTSSSADASQTIPQKNQTKSSAHGTSYHIRLAVTILLHAFQSHVKGEVQKFEIKLEDPTNGKFDDIVLNYTKSQESPCSVYIQAKHKKNPNKNSSVPLTKIPSLRREQNSSTVQKNRADITKESLLTEWSSKNSYSIAMYFISFLENFRQSTSSSHMYILVTNASIAKDLKDSLILKKFNCPIQSIWYEIGANCYQFKKSSEFVKVLNEKLINSSVECLGEKMAYKVFHNKIIDFSTPLFNVHSTIIENCVNFTKLEKTKFYILEFREDIQNTKAETLDGKFIRAFQVKYSMFLKNNRDNVWSDVKKKQITATKVYFTDFVNCQFKLASDFETIDHIIADFYNKFMLVCDSMNEEDLYENLLNIMPKWVNDKKAMYNDLHVNIFEAMQGKKSAQPINFDFIKTRFIETLPNKITSELQKSTKAYKASARQVYPYIDIQPDRLKNSKFVKNVNHTNFYGVFRYFSPLVEEISSLIVMQTLDICEKKYVFIRQKTFNNSDDLTNVIKEVLEYISQVNHTSINLITIVGKLDENVIETVSEKALTYKKTVVIIENIDETLGRHLSVDEFIIKDLTDETLQQLFKQNNELKLYGTTTSLSKIVNENDSLIFLFKILNLCENLGNTNVNTINFESIREMYIPRSCVLYSENASDPAENHDCFTLDYPSDIDEIPLDRIALKDEKGLKTKFNAVPSRLADTMCDLPNFADIDDEKIFFILLNDAGYGKSTYVTWLAWRLSAKYPCLHVVRLNALQYSTDFSRLNHSDFQNLNDVQVLRLLYRFIHMALFSPNVASQSVTKNDMRRNIIDRCAKLLTLDTDSRIVLDIDQLDNAGLTSQQLLELRIFQTKYNEKQIVLLIDGFDEICPHYKNVVLKYFAHFIKLQGIRQAYLSSRPYDFKYELENMFDNCRLYQLQPFCQDDQILYLHKYLDNEINGYRRCNPDHRYKISYILYNVIAKTLDELKSIPLFINIALISLLPIIKSHINFDKETFKVQLVLQTKIDRLQLLQTFVNNKIKILLTEKCGASDSISYTPSHLSQQENQIKQTHKQHALLAMYIMFDVECRQHLLSNKQQTKAKQIMAQICQGHEKTGLISGIQDDIPQFNHRIFAEYFAAYWLYENKNSMKNIAFFRSKTFWTPSLIRMRDFFDRLVVKDSNDCGLHMAVLKQSAEEVSKLMLNNPYGVRTKDAMGRLPLHLAVQNKCVKVVQNLLRYNDNGGKNSKDGVMEWSALDYACVVGSTESITLLLERGAKINVQTLLKQVVSNDLRTIVTEAHNYGKWLLITEDTEHNVYEFLNEVVNYLVEEFNLDLYDHYKELDSLTVLEFCVIHNMSELLKRFACLTNEVSKYLTSDSCSILKLAFHHKKYDSLIYLINELDISIPQETDADDLFMALKFLIERNESKLFGTIFHILCLQRNILCSGDTHKNESMKNKYNINFSILDKDLFPKECCERSPKNKKLPLPEYNDNDALHEGYFREDLIAKAVDEGNLNIISYIAQITNLTITNRLIVKIMRLLPKHNHVCNHKSIPAFMYLLDRSIDLEKPDEIGRNLFHMTAQNGCFCMLHCLVLKGFDPTLPNKENGWNVFHYAILNDDEDRVDKIMTYLTKYTALNLFEHLSKMFDSDYHRFVSINDNTSIANIRQNVNTLHTSQHFLIAILSVFEAKNEKGSVKLLSEEERKEANACIGNGHQETTLLKSISNEPPKFTHRIFAEYFAACWLYKNKNCMRNKSFFRSVSYWTPSLHRLRDFFDQLVIRDSTYSNIHMPVHNQSEKHVSKMMGRDCTLAYARDAIGRSPLDLAVRSESFALVQKILVNFPFQLIDRADKIFKFSALDYAFICGDIGSIKLLIERGATVNVDTLVDQIISPNLKVLLECANNYGNWLQLCERKLNTDQFFTRVVQYLLEEMKVNKSNRHSDIDSLTVLEFCAKYNMVGIFDKFIAQFYASDQISLAEKNQLLKIAFENNADDIVDYIVNKCNTSHTQLTNVIGLIPTLHFCTRHSDIQSFKVNFDHLCLKGNVHVDNEIDIVDNLSNQDHLPAIDKNLFPKVCCVHSSIKIQKTPVEYDYICLTLLTNAIYEGKPHIASYIIDKTKMTITNELILIVLGMLPRGEHVCHHKSMPAFMYLLDKTTDLKKHDKEGRNLLHVVAENGCFFMLQCLILKGFDPTLPNVHNRWNVFHYAKLNIEESGVNRRLEYLTNHILRNIPYIDESDLVYNSNNYLSNHASHNWFDQLECMTNSTCFDLSIQNETPTLLHEQYHLLGMFNVFDENCMLKILDTDFQSSVACLSEINLDHMKFWVIKSVNSEIPQFKNRVVAEYFAACWLYINKNLLQIKSFFRSKSFWTPSLQRVRDLFDRMILRESQVHDLHKAVLNKSQEIVDELLPNLSTAELDKDGIGRTPLHLASMYNWLSPFKMVMEGLPENEINRTDDAFKWSALDYAFVIGSHTSIKLLLEREAKINEDNLFQQIISNNLRVLLFDTHNYANWLQCEIKAKQLIKRVVQYLRTERQLKIKSVCEELDSLTVNEFCKRHEMHTIIKQLKEQKFEISKVSTWISDITFQRNN